MSLSPRVLVIGPELIMQWTESTARALESMDCRVHIHYYSRLGLHRGLQGLRQFLIRRARIRLPPIPHAWLNWYAAWQAIRTGRRLVEEARTFRPDLILILKGESLQARTLRRLKERTSATLVGWWVDHPFMKAEAQRLWPAVPACVPHYDACFVFDRSYEAGLRAGGAPAVYPLPCAADPALFKPQRLTWEEQAAYQAAVSLVGVYTESRGQVVKALCEVPGLGIWGPGWQGWLADRRVLEAFRGRALPPSEVCKVYNASQVNLNTHHHQSRDGGVNTRAFEILASRAFELTDHVPGMESLLEPGREVVVYRSPEEAVDLVRYYVKAEDERRRIAEAGHKRVLAEHTYRHRMQTLLRVVAR